MAAGTAREVASARLRASAIARPVAVDAVLALALYLALTFGVTAQVELDRDDGQLLGAVINLVVVAPLALRRRVPLLVLAVVLAAAAAGALALGGLIGGEAAVLVALGTVAAREPRTERVALATATVAAAVLAMVIALGPDDPRQLVATSLAAVVAAVAVGVALRARTAQLAALADRAARLAREREQERELAVAAERARIARELHDVVAHNVSVMVALADGAQHTIDAAPEQARAAMGHVAATGRDALHELRGLVGVLGNDDSAAGATRAPQPSIDQVEDLLERVRASGLQARLRVEGQPRPLSPLADMTLYRIVQEALTNVLRHADQATRVEVRVGWTPREVELEIVDDGRAAPADADSSSGGRGVPGMRERASVVSAPLTAGPLAGGGWRVATRVPLPENTAVGA